MDVNLDTLNGSAVLNLNSLILISMVLNVFSAFMIIETANFSLYNIILILSILTGVMGVYSMIHLQGN
ncbi:putative membrane protein [[Clostridium] sordellii ATCC 9714]|nr:putative membrane protein [[Clostridium] sordellii ATCC 9714] [Paeniclostridium sordellii ATCC 9714]